MIFQRGNPLDYERWAAAPGMQSWDYAHCLPYFKKLESCMAAAHSDEWRGKNGPLTLERGPATNELFGAFFEAVKQAGYSLTDDMNGWKQEGFGMFDRMIRQGKRCSASVAYLHTGNVISRPNLTVICNATVNRLLLKEGRVEGVEYSTVWGGCEWARGAEVIVCGGAINSPQLLQVSGIGDALLLKQAGIKPLHALKGVGQNLQDHLEVKLCPNILSFLSQYPRSNCHTVILPPGLSAACVH
jgi:choline dehydrogenase